MPNYNVRDFFTTQRVTPSSLQQSNLIQFSYHSPDGVHDNMPLVYVVEKRRDRFYGFNLHYDSNQLVELIDNKNFQVDTLLENAWAKVPKNKKRLIESGEEFNRGFIEKKDFKLITSKIQKKVLEQFLIENLNVDTLRIYLFKRMNAVSKMIYKVNQ